MTDCIRRHFLVYVATCLLTLLYRTTCALTIRDYLHSIGCAVYFSWHEPPYNHIWSISNLRRLFSRSMNHRTTIYGEPSNRSRILSCYLSTCMDFTYVLLRMNYPTKLTCSSVGQAGFCCHFPGTNDRTRFTLMWGLLRLAPIKMLLVKKTLIK